MIWYGVESTFTQLIPRSNFCSEWCTSQIGDTPVRDKSLMSLESSCSERLPRGQQSRLFPDWSILLLPPSYIPPLFKGRWTRVRSLSEDRVSNGLSMPLQWRFQICSLWEPVGNHVVWLIVPILNITVDSVGCLCVQTGPLVTSVYDDNPGYSSKHGIYWSDPLLLDI